MSLNAGPPVNAAAQAFGSETLGPILADFARQLWLFQRLLPDSEQTTLLFCARGGLRLGIVYERFLARTGLPARIAADSLMVSRLVAARTCAPRPGDALLSELGREFAGQPMSAVAAALAQHGDRQLGPDWQAPFERERFVALLARSDPMAMALRQDIADQDALFRAHLAARTQGRPNVVLCDTGLYGSTVRLLRDGVPEHRWSCVQFARSNYKGLATPHFDCTVGLSVESDRYLPWDASTSALRCWQLIEAVLEPPLPSVRRFAAGRAGEGPIANLEIEGWPARLAPDEPGLFAGVLAHIDELDGAALPGVPGRAAAAWRRFRRAVIWPGEAEVAMLSLGERSRDFGRVDHVSQFATPAGTGVYKSIRDSLWREGAAVRLLPRFRRLALLAIESAYVWRALSAGAKTVYRKVAPRPHRPGRIREPAVASP